MAEDESLLTEQYEKCQNAHFTNIDWAQCGYEEIERQKANLAKAKLEAFENIKRFTLDHSECKGCGYIENEPLKSFTQEQENWEKWKDSACEYILLGGYGREPEVLAYPRCKAEIIAQRAEFFMGVSADIKRRID